MSSADQTLRRKLRFRAWHRGIKEMDLVLGTFADRHLQALDEQELGEFARLLELPDRELFAWVVGNEAIPGEYDTPLLRRIVALRLRPDDYLHL
jgi:antitoxin CptB